MKLSDASWGVATMKPGRCGVAVMGIVWLAGAVARVAAGAGELDVLTWGGAYQASQQAAYFEPFERRTGTRVRVHRYDGGLDGLRREVASGAPAWDVVDLVESDARAACREGLLERLDPALLVDSPDGVAAAEDFDPGALTRCAVAQVWFSTVIAFDARAFPGDKPRTVADFFDLKRFPGKRALRCAPDSLLEWALLAYAVTPAQIYDLLSTERGLDLAFRKLDAIRPALVWWRDGEEPARLLREGAVAMASGYNGRLFHAQVVLGEPLSIMWDGQVLERGTWAIARGTSNMKLARDFIRFATEPDRMASQAAYIPYAPTRASARRRVGLHVGTGVDMNDHMPTTGARVARAVHKDSEWYARTASLRAERFAAWLGEGGCR